MAEYNKNQLIGVYDLGEDVWDEYRLLDSGHNYEVQITFHDVKEAQLFIEQQRKQSLRKQEIIERVMRMALADIDPREDEYDPDDPTCEKDLEVDCLWNSKKFAAYLEKNDY